MDWKAFIASIIGSLAWPIVVIALLVLLRKQLVELAERLQEFSLGGAKATFEKQLETARQEADKLPPPPEVPDDQRVVPLTDEKKFLRLAEEFPEAAVIQVYKGIEQILFTIGDLLDLRRTDAESVIRELYQREEIDGNTRDLFSTLRNARNVAAHGIGNRRISPGEALDYKEHSLKLTSRLSFILGKVGVEARHKQTLQQKPET